MQRSIVSSRRALQVLLALMFVFSLAIPQLDEPLTVHAVDDPRATTGEWAPAFDWGIFGKHMAMMPNGKVLAWPTGQDAFVWDPQTQTKVAVPANFGDLHCAAQTFLSDGRVIVAGGVVISPHDGITVTAIFDPATNEWTNAAPMHFARWYGTTTRLPDGRILASSGDIAATTGTRALLPEIYDPATNQWTVMPDTASKDLSLYPQMFVLPNGKVYKAASSASTYSLDVNAGTWANGPTNAYGSSGYAESSAMYEPGKILRSGGGDPSFANAAIIDMTAASPQWKQVSPMNHPRRRHNMVILADGEVMAVGGTGSADDLSAAVYEGEIWNPATELWTPTAAMTYDRMYHSAALLLPDGRVLTSGGEFNGRYKAQIFSPPYLFKGARPAISAAPSAVGYGAGFSLDVTITDGSTIQGVALIGLNAVTHAFDHNQRYVPLSFSQSGSTLNVVAPANGNIAPPGYYQLVVKDSKGVPSVARFIRVDSIANLTPGNITGTVTDGDGNPVSGASVSYAGGATTTAADGSYTLDNINPGELVVTFAKSGFATVKRTQPVGGGATMTLDVMLTPPGTITGKITNSETGIGISGAIVTYSGGTVTADADGNYTLSELPSGGQTISAVATGYNSSPDQNVTLPANMTITVDIALTPKPSFVAGEAHDSVTLQVVPDASVTIGTYSGTTDATGRYLINVPPGIYTMTVLKPGYKDYINPSVVVTFGSYTAVDPVLEPINPPITFTPVADTYTNSAAPDANNGTATTLRAVTGTGTNPVQKGYLRFNVTDLTGVVQSAKLRMYVTNTSDKAGAIFSVSDTYTGTTTQWTETGLTWNNAPLIGGTPLVTGGSAQVVGTWLEFDVTAGVTGNGIVDFGLQNTSTNDVRYSTREDAVNKPQLVIQQTIPPTITSFTPASGGPGAEVTITGTGFSGATAVAFNGVAVTSFTVDSATQVRAVVPVGASTGKISMTTPNGSATSATSFTFIGPAGPTLGGFSPTFGPTGTEVTLTGTGFSGATAVKFGGVAAASFTVDSATQIRAVVPVSASTGKISVTTATGSATSAANFTVLTSTGAVPLGFSPTYGLAGSLVTITGAGFVGVTAVAFNGLAASSFTVDSATQIRAVVPFGASTGKISVVTTSGVQVAASDYNVSSQAPKYSLYLPIVLGSASATQAGLRTPASANVGYAAPTAEWLTGAGAKVFFCPLN